MGKEYSYHQSDTSSCRVMGAGPASFSQPLSVTRLLNWDWGWEQNLPLSSFHCWGGARGCNSAIWKKISDFTRLKLLTFIVHEAHI